MPAERAVRDYYGISALRAAKYSGKMVSMVHALPVEVEEGSVMMPGGRRVRATDIFCEVDVTRSQLLGAYQWQQTMKNHKATTKNKPAKGGAASSAVATTEMAAVATTAPTDKVTVERYARIKEGELKRAQLWWSEPKTWRLGIAWAFHLAMLIAMSALLLFIALKNPHFQQANLWKTQVIVGFLEAQASKMLALEPLLALALPLNVMMLRCQPMHTAMKVRACFPCC